MDVETRWTLIRKASEGDHLHRSEFAVRYLPLITGYLTSRWAASPLRTLLEDAVQEVFVTIYKPGGPLTSASPVWSGGFRAYLYGVVRNVARGFERSWARRREVTLGDAFGAEKVAAREPGLARSFDRAWAHAVLRQAAALQAEQAAGDPEALRRIELLKLRFQGDLPIRDIAARWGVEPRSVHRAYARARREFQAALRDVLRVHGSESTEKLDEEALRVLDALS